MRISRDILVATAVIGMLATCWIGSEIYYAKSISPSGVRTVADHFHRFGEPHRITQFQHQGATYYELSGIAHKVPALAFPSSPPAYIYDDSGKFVAWCSDPGDRPAFRELWQMTNAQQVDIATFRKKYDH
ncbi:MAG: hypothetical protein WCH99_07520 [Verrucomicrobiota bacterium]